MNKPSLLFRIFRHTTLFIFALLFVMPFIWMLLTSFKPADEIFSAHITFFPHKWDVINNYTEALTKVPLLHYIMNGIFVCGVILILQILINLPAAYAFAKMDFKGKSWLWRLVLLSLMVPYQATAIPVYIMLYYAQLLDTYSALILPFASSAFGIFLFRQFFKTVSDDLVHAARMDGMSEFELVWRVMLPTAKPAIIAFAIFSVVWHWNDYFWPLLVISSPDLSTPTLGTIFFRNEESGSSFGPLMAGTVMITLPLLIFFIAAQKHFVEGITFSGVKG